MRLTASTAARSFVYTVNYNQYKNIMKDKIKSKEEAIKASPLYGIKKPCKVVSVSELDTRFYGEIGIQDNKVFLPLVPDGMDLCDFDYDKETQTLFKAIPDSFGVLVDLSDGSITVHEVGGSLYLFKPMTDEEIEACTPWYMKLWNAYPAWTWYLGAILLVVAIILYSVF